MPNLLAEAEKGGYAVGYFEAWNLQSLEAVMDAAEETRSPVILGFGGGFLENPQRADSPRLGLHAPGRSGGGHASRHSHCGRRP
ncbi:class II fructose-bisphosphate aldolase, partial [Candidatus Hakubella thermalkaliphila]